MLSMCLFVEVVAECLLVLFYTADAEHPPCLNESDAIAKELNEAGADGEEPNPKALVSYSAVDEDYKGE